eukprot:scaffold282253_cov29-Tisochrysis_lutea.AAC.4
MIASTRALPLSLLSTPGLQARVGAVSSPQLSLALPSCTGSCVAAHALSPCPCKSNPTTEEGLPRLRRNMPRCSVMAMASNACGSFLAPSVWTTSQG